MLTSLFVSADLFCLYCHSEHLRSINKNIQLIILIIWQKMARLGLCKTRYIPKTLVGRGRRRTGRRRRRRRVKKASRTRHGRRRRRKVRRRRN